MFFSFSKPLTLPLSYNHYLQGMIYSVLDASPDYSYFLHEYGHYADHHNFKLFTFSMLHGTYQIQNKMITFKNNVSFCIRSASEDFFTVFLSALSHTHNWFLNQTTLTLDSFTTTFKTIKESDIYVRMISPVCISQTYITDDNKKKPYYLTPSDYNFSELINENFIKKYQAAYGIEPEYDIIFEPSIVKPSDKLVTQFKGIYITAWKGVYHLVGNPEYLDFLYNTGIGSRNSQGFGLFDTI